jgi:hypothetical protein
MILVKKRSISLKLLATKSLFVLFVFMAGQQTQAQQTKPVTAEEQQIIQLSKQKWQWMSDKNVDSLAVLFDEKCDFTHMGGTWGKARELDIIKQGFIWYKTAEVYSTAVKFFGNTALILSDIDLVAVVGGNDAINPFMVTEVLVKENGSWKLAQLTFSKLARPLKLNAPAANAK